MSKRLSTYSAWVVAIAAVAGGLLLLRRNRNSTPTLLGAKTYYYPQYDMLNDSNLARGYRNNNPLNIDYYNSAGKRANNWLGQIGVEPEGRFAQFIDMAHGYRAALMTMRTYIKKYGLNTVYKIINRWAPADDGNNPDGYTQRVCKATGLTRDMVVGINDRDTLTKMAYGMSIVENDDSKHKAANHAAGLPNMEIINQGWELI